MKYRQRLSLDEKLELIMECRNSGLSDRQWCIENNFPMSTMYNWISKLRKNACPDISENPNKYCSSPSAKQDVVCIDVKQHIAQSEVIDTCHDSEHMILQYNGAEIIIPDQFNDKTLARVINVLRESLC